MRQLKDNTSFLSEDKLAKELIWKHSIRLSLTESECSFGRLSKALTSIERISDFEIVRSLSTKFEIKQLIVDFSIIFGFSGSFLKGKIYK